MTVTGAIRESKPTRTEGMKEQTGAMQNLLHPSIPLTGDLVIADKGGALKATAESPPGDHDDLLPRSSLLHCPAEG